MFKSEENNHNVVANYFCDCGEWEETSKPLFLGSQIRAMKICPECKASVFVRVGFKHNIDDMIQNLVLGELEIEHCKR